jgi:hypothetical protein
MHTQRGEYSLTLLSAFAAVSQPTTTTTLSASGTLGRSGNGSGSGTGIVSPRADKSRATPQVRRVRVVGVRARVICVCCRLLRRLRTRQRLPRK